MDIYNKAYLKNATEEELNNCAGSTPHFRHQVIDAVAIFIVSLICFIIYVPLVVISAIEAYRLKFMGKWIESKTNVYYNEFNEEFKEDYLEVTYRGKPHKVTDLRLFLCEINRLEIVRSAKFFIRNESRLKPWQIFHNESQVFITLGRYFDFYKQVLSVVFVLSVMFLEGK